MSYLRYRDDIETLEPDEQATIDGIIQGMTQQSEVVEKREQHAVRASHAKSSACVVGTLTIADDLPPELAQGLFAEPGSGAPRRVGDHKVTEVATTTLENLPVAAAHSVTRSMARASGLAPLTAH